jgi:hypothetical protein
MCKKELLQGQATFATKKSNELQRTTFCEIKPLPEDQTSLQQQVK